MSLSEIEVVIANQKTILQNQALILKARKRSRRIKQLSMSSYETKRKSGGPASLYVSGSFGRASEDVREHRCD